MLDNRLILVDLKQLTRAGNHFSDAIYRLLAGGVRDEIEHEVVVSEVKMGLTMTGPAKGIVGAAVAYQITVSNGGSLPLRLILLLGLILPIPSRCASSAGAPLRIAGSMPCAQPMISATG